MTHYMADPDRMWGHNQHSSSRTKNWLTKTLELEELYSPEHPPSMLSGFVPDNDDTYSTHSLPPKMTIRYKDGRQPQYISHEHHKRSDIRSRPPPVASAQPRPSHARSSSEREVRQDRTRSKSLGNTTAIPAGSSHESSVRSRSQGNTSIAVNPPSSRSQNSHHSRAQSAVPQPQAAMPHPVPVNSYPTYNHSDVPEDIKILPTNSPEPLPIPPPLPRTSANQSSSRGGPPRPLPPRLYPQPPESTSSWVYLPSNYAPSTHAGAGPMQQSQSQPIPSKHNFPRHAPRVVAQQPPPPSSSHVPNPAIVVTAPSSHASSAPAASATRPRSRSSGSKPGHQSMIYTPSTAGPGPIVVQLNHNGPPSVRYTQSAPVPGQKSSMPSLVPVSATTAAPAAPAPVNLGNGTRYVERAGDAQFASVRGSMLGTVNEDYERRDRRSMHSRSRSIPRGAPASGATAGVAAQPQQPTIMEHPEHSRSNSHSVGTLRDSNGSYVVVGNSGGKDKNNKPTVKVHVSRSRSRSPPPSQHQPPPQSRPPYSAPPISSNPQTPRKPFFQRFFSFKPNGAPAGGGAEKAVLMEQPHHPAHAKQPKPPPRRLVRRHSTGNSSRGRAARMGAEQTRVH